ncbi:hypothetical protein PF008_g19032 [Phytophthora fragariae]|uniref:Uncharacterized protein n=1 Tax=Phytophthora fragariae TaxID=53985 RepID=A0A6G0R3V3_9STRA|nr:hypothetical protein PF008_g19032 [Phytophthora fragariae]
MQEACCKDVERCSGVLQAQWRIPDTPCRLWSATAMETVMKACVILHSMIVEDKSAFATTNPHSYLFDAACQPGGIPVQSVRDHRLSLECRV